MGLQRINTRADGQPIDDSWFNQLIDAMIGYLVPRNASGVVTDVGGSLGTATYKWLKAFVSTGYFSCGDFKYHHSYNGSVGPGEGWMLCDGRVINETNYDTEHGAGAWATYVGTSPLDGKYLPNLTAKYLIGKATTPQTGSSAITSVGNAGNTIDLSHLHKVYEDNGTGAAGQSYNSSGSATNISLGSKGAGSAIYPGTNAFISDSYTSKSLSASTDIRPASVQVQIYMRII